MKKVTMKDIAEKAGVSTTTVSKILNNVDMHISEATRARVLGLVQEYHYIPNEIAKGLKGKHSNTIGVVTYDITDPFVSKIVNGIESVCKVHGISVLICNTDTEETSEYEDLRFLSSKMVDGVIFLRSLYPKNEKVISQFKMPVIVVDREFAAQISDMGMIDSSSVEAAYMATELLAEKGCSRIAYIGPSPNTRSSSRVEGYINALQDNNIQPDEKLIYQQGDFTCETGIKGANSILVKTKVDGVVCANDLIAAGVLLTLSKAGIRVPEDVKVTGIDNISISQYLNPPLTTIDLHGYEIGTECAKMLISRVRDNVPLDKKHIACEMVMRESV